MAFDSNSDTSSTRSTGTFLCGEILRNQSGRLSGSMWRNSNSTFFSRSTIAARCTQGQVLKLTSRCFAMADLAGIYDDPSWHGGARGVLAFPGCGAAWSEAQRCAADPGSRLFRRNLDPGSAAQHCVLRCVRGTPHAHPTSVEWMRRCGAATASSLPRWRLTISLLSA